LRLADPARSRTVLIGTPFHSHTDEQLPDVPVVANKLADLASVFADPNFGGFDDRHCVQSPQAQAWNKSATRWGASPRSASEPDVSHPIQLQDDLEMVVRRSQRFAAKGRRGYGCR
jgi:hypothetical protein